jgi:hypothetical protein
MRLAGNVPEEAVGVPRGSVSTSGSRLKLLDQRSQTFRHRFFERVVIGSEPPSNRQQPLSSIMGVVRHGDTFPWLWAVRANNDLSEATVPPSG